MTNIAIANISEVAYWLLIQNVIVENFENDTEL